MSFENLNLSTPILQALKSRGYVNPTPVQEKAIPVILSGKDLMGSAQTGTGKTAAFALPLLQLMNAKPAAQPGVRTLVLAPTRELATQIADSFTQYGKHLNFKHAVIYGGVSQHGQTSQLRNGASIIIATPGRLLDLMQQGFVKLNAIEFLVLDEADKMLDMGFINDIKRIVSKVPASRQTIFFSATLSPEIKKLASSMLRNPVSVDVKHEMNFDVLLEEKLYLVDKINKTALLSHLIKEDDITHALVFTRTKHGADKLARSLNQSGIRASAIHGNKSQSQRQRTLDDFKMKKVTILVATDVASRGIDVKNLSHVVNYDLPDQADSYTHRIGRTGRAGASGIAISFCSSDERMLLRDIQKAIGKNIPVIPNPASITTSAGFSSNRTPVEAAPSRNFQKSHRSGGSSGNVRRRERQFR